MHLAQTRFQAQLEASRQDLLEHVSEQERLPFQDGLGAIETSMNSMQPEALLIFEHLSNNLPEKAGTRMATMDRRYAELRTAPGFFGGYLLAGRCTKIDFNGSALKARAILFPDRFQ